MKSGDICSDLSDLSRHLLAVQSVRAMVQSSNTALVSVATRPTGASKVPPMMNLSIRGTFPCKSGTHNTLNSDLDKYSCQGMES